MNPASDRIERKILLKAPRSQVWRVLANAEAFGQWFGVALEGKRFVAGGFKQKRCTASNAQSTAMGDDVVMVQTAKDFAFGCQAIVVRHVNRYLQNEVFIACVIVDEKGIA